MNRKRQMAGTRRAATWLRLTGMIICMLALALIPGAAMAAVQEGPVVNPANGHQYYLLSPNTWTGTEAEAIAMGGHLVTINDAAENTWVWETFAGHGPLWIGLSDAAQEGVFVWAGGEPATYFNWWSRSSSDYEPNNLGGVEHYVEMNNYVWNDNINERLFFAVVEVGKIVITPPAPIIVTAPPVVVNNGAGDEYDPHVSGDWAAYTSDNSIRYYNFATNTDAAIPMGSSARDLLSDISGSKIVFSRVITAVKTAVMVFDAATAATPIEIDAALGTNRLGSAIGGNTVAYIDFGLHANGELVIHDLVSSTSVRATINVTFDQNPSVSPDGTVVTWEHCATSTSNCDIWQAVKGTAGWTVSVAMGSANPEANPDTNGSLVVYDSIRGLDRGDLFWRPVGGGAEVQLKLPGVEANPSIAGNFIAFESRPTLFSTSDIFVYDITTNLLYQITDTPLVTEQLNDITVLLDGRIRVVWGSDEDGFDHRNVHAATFSLPGPVDNTPPETTITGTLINVTSATFTFGSNEAGSAFQCQLDGGVFAACTSPKNYAGLANGSHTFQVRAVDTAGNIDPSPASFTWAVVTPAQGIQNLIAAIKGMGLPTGVENSLIAPLGQASALLNDNNPNNDIAACGKLDAFINQVNAKAKSGQLMPAQASQLLQAANAIKASLGCP